MMTVPDSCTWTTTVPNDCTRADVVLRSTLGEAKRATIRVTPGAAFAVEVAAGCRADVRWLP